VQFSTQNVCIVLKRISAVLFGVELCADELVVGGGVGWSYDRRRRAFFIGGGGVALWSAAPAASDWMREH